MADLFDRPITIILILVIIILLFGSKKLPDAARGLGRSLRIFKAETKGLLTDDETTAAQPPAPAAPQQIAAPPAVPAPPIQQGPSVPQPVVHEADKSES
jgi:sec-independent protein translocase protein TatA